MPDITDDYINRAAMKMGGDPELLRRAIAKQQGVPYAPPPAAAVDAPAIEAPAPGMIQAVDGAIATPVGLQADLVPVDAALATPLGAQAEPPPATIEQPIVAPSAVDSMTEVRIPVQPATEIAPKAQSADLVPATAVTTQPDAAATDPAVASDTGAAVAAQATGAAAPTDPLDQLTLQPSIQSASSDAKLLAQTNKEANERIAAVEEETAKKKLEQADRFRRDIEESAKEHGSVEAGAQALADKTFAEYQQINEEARKLPPIRDSRSGSERMWGAIAVALGGMQDQNNLVAGLMQGMNVQTRNADQAAELINRSVERDIATQKANHENKRADAHAKFNEYSLARARIQDAREAEKFALLLRKERYLSEMDVLTSELDVSTARDKARLKIGADLSATRKEMNDLLQTELGTKGQLAQAIALGKMTPEQAAAFIGGIGADPAAGPTKAEVKAAKGASDVNKSQEQLAQGYHEPGAKLAPDTYVADAEIWNRKKTEEKSKELATDFQSKELIRQMQEMRDYIAANPDYASNIDKRSTLDAKRSAILTTFKNAKELGSLDNGVERVVNQSIGDPTGWKDSIIAVAGGQPTALATLDEQLRESRIARQSRRENNGLGNTAPKPAESPAKPAKPGRAAANKPAIVVKRRDASAELDALK